MYQLIHMTRREAKPSAKSKIRYPNLSTILMVEKVLKKNADRPLTLAQLKKELPSQIMHQTLKITLEYLWESGKIIFGPKGFQWIYMPPHKLKKLLDDSIEV